MSGLEDTMTSTDTGMLARMEAAVRKAYSAMEILKRENAELRKENELLKNTLSGISNNHLDRLANADSRQETESIRMDDGQDDEISSQEDSAGPSQGAGMKTTTPLVEEARVHRHSGNVNSTADSIKSKSSQLLVSNSWACSEAELRRPDGASQTQLAGSTLEQQDRKSSALVKPRKPLSSIKLKRKRGGAGESSQTGKAFGSESVPLVSPTDVVESYRSILELGKKRGRTSDSFSFPFSKVAFMALLNDLTVDNVHLVAAELVRERSRVVARYLLEQVNVLCFNKSLRDAINIRASGESSSINDGMSAKADNSIASGARDGIYSPPEHSLAALISPSSLNRLELLVVALVSAATRVTGGILFVEAVLETMRCLLLAGARKQPVRAKSAGQGVNYLQAVLLGYADLECPTLETNATLDIDSRISVKATAAVDRSNVAVSITTADNLEPDIEPDADEAHFLALEAARSSDVLGDSRLFTSSDYALSAPPHVKSSPNSSGVSHGGYTTYPASSGDIDCDHVEEEEEEEEDKFEAGASSLPNRSRELDFLDIAEPEPDLRLEWIESQDDDTAALGVDLDNKCEDDSHDSGGDCDRDSDRDNSSGGGGGGSGDRSRSDEGSIDDSDCDGQLVGAEHGAKLRRRGDEMERAEGIVTAPSRGDCSSSSAPGRDQAIAVGIAGSVDVYGDHGDDSAVSASRQQELLSMMDWADSSSDDDHDDHGGKTDDAAVGPAAESSVKAASLPESIITQQAVVTEGKETSIPTATMKAANTARAGPNSDIQGAGAVDKDLETIISTAAQYYVVISTTARLVREMELMPNMSPYCLYTSLLTFIS